MADGWIAASTHDVTRLARDVEMVREGAREAGRDQGLLRIVVRVVPDVRARAKSRDRKPFQGSRSQVLADIHALNEHGVTEVLIDLNLSPFVVGPNIDAKSAMAYARRVLDELAPAGDTHMV